MNQFVPTFLIAISNNVDNTAARIAYSIKGIRISFPVNLWITVITFAITYFATVSGTIISGLLSKRFSSIVAMVILTAIGLWMILEQYLKKADDHTEEPQGEEKKGVFHIMRKPERADMDRSKHIDFKEATLLGIALSINNVGGGVSAGMIGLIPFWVGLSSALVNFVIMWGGNYMAETFIRWNLSHRATVVAGMILIAIGIEQVL